MINSEFIEILLIFVVWMCACSSIIIFYTLICTSASHKGCWSPNIGTALMQIVLYRAACIVTLCTSSQIGSLITYGDKL
jgi:hypothetical protein